MMQNYDHVSDRAASRHLSAKKQPVPSVSHASPSITLSRSAPSRTNGPQRRKQDARLRHADDRRVLHHRLHMRSAYLGMVRHAHAHPRRLAYHRAMLPPLTLQSHSSFSWRERGGGRCRVTFQTHPHRRGARPSRSRPGPGRIDVPYERGGYQWSRPNHRPIRSLRVHDQCVRHRGVLLLPR